MNEMVRLSGVAKNYGEVTALRPTDLVIGQGEFVTLLGPSGSGKTTILNLIAGTIQPSAGRIWIHGRDVTSTPANQRQLGMVFQNYALFPHMTIKENIAFPLKIRRMTKAEIDREVARVLELVKLPQVADRKPKELSGGQQQRIAIARSLVYHPDLILMDEPLGALDKKLRDQMQLEIKRLHETLRMTVLYVTHDQEEALVMSDRVCLMNNGQIEQIGTPEDLYFRPRTVFSADFLGESNILEAEVLSGGPACRLRISGETVVGDVRGCAASPGTRIQVLIRPENVRLAGESGGRESILQGTVDEVIFLGGVTNLRARLANGAMVIAKNLTRREGTDWAKGMPVRLTFDAGDVVVLEGSGQEAETVPVVPRTAAE
ncbi:ABC transporter ATP-binding protein [Rhodoligotrophos ferricapiens]|uniref:ABC transporter ATP-binding protein n=1 Tax=Rhodoligotrophos ferricapiens TaxID=3069264 RepID=UPI00315D558F